MENNLLIPNEEDTYQNKKSFDIYHEVESIAKNRKCLTGKPYIDIQILKLLDDISLNTVCQISPYLADLCIRDELWIERIILKYGLDTLRSRPSKISLHDFYNILDVHKLLAIFGLNQVLKK
jgi:hypothetical protein